MRVLVMCFPQTGHVVPLLPLAEALFAQGDDVLFVSGTDVGDAVTARGVPFRGVGPGMGEWYGALVARTRGNPGDGLAPANVERYFLPRLFGEVGVALTIDPVLDVARAHRAELLVYDQLYYAGPLAAAVLGVPGVCHAVGPMTAPEVTELVADAVSPIWREFGHDVPPHAGIYSAPTVTICPPTLDPAGAALAGARPMRPTPPPARHAARPAEIPPALWERPVVYITLGTFSNANVAMFRLLVDAAADLPVSVIATVGRDVAVSALGDVPDHVHVAQFIPQAELLPHCAAAIHHAGAGTAFGILAHGLPSVAAPQSADNFTIAARIGTAGAAQVLMPGEVTVDSVRSALAKVLDDASYAEAARGLAAEIEQMPSPGQVAAQLRELVS